MLGFLHTYVGVMMLPWTAIPTLFTVVKIKITSLENVGPLENRIVYVLDTDALHTAITKYNRTTKTHELRERG